MVLANFVWKLVASPYTMHGGDKVLWTVRGVELELNASKITLTIMSYLDAVWGVRCLVGCWVENTMSTYVVVRSIPEGK